MRTIGMLLGIPEEDQRRAKVFFDKGDQLVKTGGYDYAIEMYIQGLNMAQPLFLGVYAGDATKNNQMLAALTRDSWLKGITQGVDQLTHGLRLSTSL